MHALTRFGVLERRLFLTVFAGLLPLAVLSFATFLQNAQTQKQQLLESAVDTMRATITAVDSELNIALASLDALSASPRLARNDFEAFQAEARELLQRRTTWANVVLAEPSAQQVMNARVPFGTPLPANIDREGIAETVRTGKSGVGDILFSPILQQWTFGVRVPIHQEGTLRYVLIAQLRPDAVQQLLLKQRTPEGVTGIFDRNYNVVARTLNHDEFVGKHPAPELHAALLKGDRSGTIRSSTLEGAQVYSAFYRSETSGLSAAIGIPRAALDGPTHLSYLVLTVSILFSLLLGLIAATLVGRAITRPMRELEVAAIDLGHGKAPIAPQTNLPEILKAASALSQAHVEREDLLQRERQARLMEQEARLLAETASKTKDEFLAMLGHELRNPLAAISTASQVLDHSIRTPSRDMAVEATGIIRRQVVHLARLTDDLLDAGRVVIGKVKLNRKPLELSSAVQSCIETLRSTHRLTDHELTLALDSVWIDADSTRVDQVIANLLANAAKYTPAPGSIHVQVSREGNEAVLTVRDSGVGLDPELLPRVFDLFVQGQRTLDRAQGGLGIGLTLVRRLVELHGGNVEARSAGADRGSEFIVRLPAIDAPAQIEEKEDAAAPSTGQLTVVVVEDNADVRVGVRHLLELSGHQVHEASDGPSGVETILRVRADLALIDIGLPLMDGYGVARAVRARGTSPVYLVAMTGYGSADDMSRGMRAGFDDYLVKPVDPALLVQIFTRLPAR